MPANQSQILRMPYILPGQAQKHVTHNEVLKLLDVLVQLVVTSRHPAQRPARRAPPYRARWGYLFSPGAWSGQAGYIAVYQNDTCSVIETLVG